MTKQAWKQEEVKLLIKDYVSVGPSIIADKLGRTMKQVSKKARSLGLYRGIAAGNKARKHIWTFTTWSYDLGYIVGVYLGDGNVYIEENQTAYFRHCSIDKEFCETVRYKIQKITGHTGSIVFSDTKQQYIFTFANVDFANWLKDNFGGPNEKRITLLPSQEANNGMLEGITDSEGTIKPGSISIRMGGNLKAIETICKSLGIKRGHQHIGVYTRYDGLSCYSISTKEYTRVGLGTYIKRKAKHGVVYKDCDYQEACRNADQQAGK